MFKMPTLIIILFLIAIGYFFINKVSPQKTQQYTGPAEKIRIGNIGEYSIFNIIAKEKGYFKQNGLDTEIIEYESGPPAIAALLDGKVDVAVAADFVGVVNIFSNPQLRIITQASRHKVFYVIARRDKKINNPADIKNKKIGVTRGSAGEFYLGQFLIFNDLTLKDIRIVDLPPSKIIDQIQSGQIDAAVIFDPHAYNLKNKLGDQATIWSAHGDQITFALTYSTDNFIRNHPEIIARYLRSLLQAEQFTKENPLESQNIIAKKLNYETAYIQHMWKNFIFTHGLDQALLLTMEDQARWMINNKLTNQTNVPNYLNFIYFGALEKVQPEAITVIR